MWDFIFVALYGALFVTLMTAVRHRVFLPFVMIRALSAWKASRVEAADTITLNLPRVKADRASESILTSPLAETGARKSLCATCVYSHVVQGYERGEEITACGYSFPPRDILFAVRECTDHKPKRKRSDAEIADEGAVGFPPLEVKADDFRVAAAASPLALK